METLRWWCGKGNQPHHHNSTGGYTPKVFRFGDFDACFRFTFLLSAAPVHLFFLIFVVCGMTFYHTKAPIHSTTRTMIQIGSVLAAIYAMAIGFSDVVDPPRHGAPPPAEARLSCALIHAASFSALFLTARADFSHLWRRAVLVYLSILLVCSSLELQSLIRSYEGAGASGSADDDDDAYRGGGSNAGSYAGLVLAYATLLLLMLLPLGLEEYILVWQGRWSGWNALRSRSPYTGAINSSEDENDETRPLLRADTLGVSGEANYSAGPSETTARNDDEGNLGEMEENGRTSDVANTLYSPIAGRDVETRATILSRLVFWWVWPLLKHAYSVNRVTFDDLPLVGITGICGVEDIELEIARATASNDDEMDLMEKPHNDNRLFLLPTYSK